MSGSWKRLEGTTWNCTELSTQGLVAPSACGDANGGKGEEKGEGGTTSEKRKKTRER